MEAMKQLVPLLLLFTCADTIIVDLIQDKQVCYGDLGCFSNAAPFRSIHRPLSLVPESPDKIRTSFVLYTREWRPVPLTLDARFPETILNVWTNFTPRPTKFIIHGFVQTVATWPWMKEMAEELLRSGDYNVIIVDWSGGNQFPYTQATANTRLVGAQISLLVNHLINTGILTADYFHIIGHSLGAQTAGYAGERIRGLGRITGLDPAGPYFKDTETSVRLDKTDAKFVDVIHTASAQISQLGWGTPTLSGHADFFPNGGYLQPGCEGKLLDQILKQGILRGVIDRLFCSHMRAVEFFTESIRSPCPFLAFPCDSKDLYENNLCQTCSDVGCSRMGFHADKYKPPQGQTITYYLKTGNDAPFCVYHYTITVKFSAGPWRRTSGRPSVLIRGNEFTSSWLSLNGGAVATFSPGQTSLYNFDLPQNVGPVTSISFKWQKPLLSLPSLIINPSVPIESIDVFSHEIGTRYRVCGRGQSVKSGASITLLSC